MLHWLLDADTLEGLKQASAIFQGNKRFRSLIPTETGLRYDPIKGGNLLDVSPTATIICNRFDYDFIMGDQTRSGKSLQTPGCFCRLHGNRIFSRIFNNLIAIPASVPA
jgi:hypothetical protein